MESVYWVPDEFKELEAGKAFAKINPDKGYRMDIKSTYDSGAFEGNYHRRHRLRARRIGGVCI